jgi:hypothetical protein
MSGLQFGKMFPVHNKQKNPSKPLIKTIELNKSLLCLLSTHVATRESLSTDVILPNPVLQIKKSPPTTIKD